MRNEQVAKEVGDIYVNKGKADQASTPVTITFGVKDAKRHDDNPV